MIFKGFVLILYDYYVKNEYLRRVTRYIISSADTVFA